MLFDWFGGSVPFDREAQIYPLLGVGRILVRNCNVFF